jgi:uncharacterized protein YdhG (YjbR/CyaY superfamily)
MTFTCQSAGIKPAIRDARQPVRSLRLPGFCNQISLLVSVVIIIKINHFLPDHIFINRAGLSDIS